ncbi:gluconate 2-dehydrogenase subunit 3-like protein [Pontibacter ummariensis]|uniref:Gluconate 2-dehydrogenase subunit 3 n=2 Tax=Pontibacter ummariensis TaxID=1610492 RepID=A0A239KLE7_9BACT|nr:gluconate 2-dehydrogenase subunit 3-like protein [Pontibacter ummariensis]SNT18542.1 Gluconate 2-dehydrogenase subunit 3 [Pontibacter ummariensis]
MAWAVVGLAVLPACDFGSKKATAKAVGTSLSPSQEELLAEVVDTIIPATDTPGAKELNVHSFVQQMVTDCYEPKVQENLVKGLDTVEELADKSFSKSFGACTGEERIEVLRKMENAKEEEQKEFYSLVKGLTVRGYMNSEYVMTNLVKYEAIPGHYYGCVPVNEKSLS